MKRLFDIAVASSALVTFSPVAGVVALLIRHRLGSPILFRQRRPGLHGVPFEILKFRTMTDERGPDGALLPDEARLTPLGKALRRLSLDELPQLINVLGGELSLVGPRPLLVRYLDRFSPEQARRHEVKPGLTGWAQVNGRNGITWEEKLELDVWYVDNQSFLLDMKILAKTVAQVLKRSGISADGSATMPEFLGSNPPPAPVETSASRSSPGEDGHLEGSIVAAQSLEEGSESRQVSALGLTGAQARQSAREAS